MPLSIKNPRAEELAARVADVTGESLTQAVLVALAERLERLTGQRKGPDLACALSAISKRCAQLPDLDVRDANDISGYGPTGTFGS